MSRLEIRSYKPIDLEAVVQLHHAALKAAGAHAGEGSWDDDLSDIEGVYLANSGVFLVGLLNDRIVAMGALRRVFDERVEIKRMRVLPELQRLGLGQAMLDALEQEAVRRGYKIICLDTTIIQIAAQKMYLKNGYFEIERKIQDFPFESIFYEKRL